MEKLTMVEWLVLNMKKEAEHEAKVEEIKNRSFDLKEWEDEALFELEMEAMEDELEEEAQKEALEAKKSELIQTIEWLRMERAMGRMEAEVARTEIRLYQSELNAVIWELHAMTKEYKERIARAEARKQARDRKKAEAQAKTEAVIKEIEAVNLDGYTVDQLQKAYDEVDVKIVEYAKKAYKDISKGNCKCRDKNAKAIWDALSDLSFKIWKAKKEALVKKEEIEALGQSEDAVADAEEIIAYVTYDRLFHMTIEDALELESKVIDARIKLSHLMRELINECKWDRLERAKTAHNNLWISTERIEVRLA